MRFDLFNRRIGNPEQNLGIRVYLPNHVEYEFECGVQGCNFVGTIGVDNPQINDLLAVKHEQDGVIHVTGGHIGYRGSLIIEDVVTEGYILRNVPKLTIKDRIIEPKW